MAEPTKTHSKNIPADTVVFKIASWSSYREQVCTTFSRRNSSKLNIWVYGEERLARGSVLFVGPEGVVANHHFVLPSDVARFQFREGQYKLRVYVHLLGDQSAKLLFTQDLAVSKEQASEINSKGKGLYYDWGPDASRYFPRTPKPRPHSRRVRNLPNFWAKAEEPIALPEDKIPKALLHGMIMIPFEKCHLRQVLNILSREPPRQPA